ncbi:MAG TPA: ornithine--oxo-acid transaminase [Nitriliruptoraceae bacterium]|nr:ornithine--oxo-acid transaminase [Nitriliruptoraceae bacterium]
MSQFAANNYTPLPVTIAEGEGAWVTDVDGRRLLDALAGYSALNFGHRHPTLIAAAHAQLDRVTLTSRAFRHDQFDEFARRLAQLTGKDAILPMNTGAEAVETAIKMARRWGYRVKGVPADRATIVVATDNFHGRTTTIVSFSSDPDAREDFGPFTPGFVQVPHGDLAALRAAITDTTVAVLMEPIQGEAGVIIPPDGWLRGVRDLCTANDVLFIADEIQAGLGRTGTTFACDHDVVVPDVYVLGKALGGGVVPVSAVAADRQVMDVFTPGSHGSTFGGNPLACAVGLAVIDLLETGEYQARARARGVQLADGIAGLPNVDGARVRGLWAGIDVAGGRTGKDVCLALLDAGVLAKDTHGSTIRLAPPLTITTDEVDFLVDTLGKVLAG